MPDFRQRLQALARPDRTPIRAELPSVKAGDSPTTAVVRLYDPIDSWGEWWGVSAKEMAAVLDDLPDSVDTVELHINSPGGEVTEGVAILNLLRQHPARVVAIVDGVAASAASFLACAVDELVMAPNSELMIHDAWGLVVGNAEDMRQMADDLDRFSNNIASIYQAKAGGTVDEWRAAMERETWYSAAEAVAAGLADRVLEQPAAAGDGAKNRHDLSIFNFAGRAKAPGPQASATPPSPSPSPGQKGGSMPELTPEHLALLGLTEEASAEDIQAKLTELTATTDPPDPAPIPEGHVVVPEARLRDLEVAAQQGVAAANTLRTKEREEFLDSVRAKYAPTNREAWAKEYDRDPEGTRKHFESAPDLIPVNQIGHGGTVDLDSDYESLYGKEVAR